MCCCCWIEIIYLSFLCPLCAFKIVNGPGEDPSQEKESKSFDEKPRTAVYTNTYDGHMLDSPDVTHLCVCIAMWSELWVNLVAWAVMLGHHGVCLCFIFFVWTCVIRIQKQHKWVSMHARTFFQSRWSLGPLVSMTNPSYWHVQFPKSSPFGIVLSPQTVDCPTSQLGICGNQSKKTFSHAHSSQKQRNCPVARTMQTSHGLWTLFWRQPVIGAAHEATNCIHGFHSLLALAPSCFRGFYLM